MRIGMICPYSLTIPGGVQHQVLGLARALRDRGFDTRVLAPCDGPPPDAGVTPLGNSLPTSSNGSIAPLAPDPAAQLRVIRALRDEEFDVIHVHEPMAPGPTMTAMVLKQAPVVATYHRAGDSRAYDWFGWGVRWLAKRIEVSAAVSTEAADMARSVVGEDLQLTILFNGIELQRYRSDVPRAAEPTVFFVGRHEPRKGLDQLLEAMKRLPDETRLWVASDGPDTERLKAAHAHDSRIEWLGRISEAEKIRRLQAAWCFCAPSLGGESFGIVLLEAMAAGTPVVASDIDGYAKMSRGGTDAMLVPVGDPEALAEGLRRVVFGPASDELVASGLERAEQFSMELLAERYVELYQQAMGVSPRTVLA